MTLHILDFVVTEFFGRAGGGCVRKYFTDDLIESHQLRHSLAQPSSPLPKNSVTAKSNRFVLNRFDFQTHFFHLTQTLWPWSLITLVCSLKHYNWVWSFWTDHKLCRHKIPIPYYFNPNLGGLFRGSFCGGWKEGGK